MQVGGSAISSTKQRSWPTVRACVAYTYASEFDPGETVLYSICALPGVDIHKIARLSLNGIDREMNVVINCYTVTYSIEDDDVDPEKGYSVRIETYNRLCAKISCKYGLNIRLSIRNLKASNCDTLVENFGLDWN